jgi:hypothetical protein
MNTRHAIYSVVMFLILIASPSVLASSSSSSSTGTSGSSFDPATRLYIDVGNDTDYEFVESAGDTWPKRLDLTDAINRYVRGGCWCVGCKYDVPSRDCKVPIILKSGAQGNVTVDDANMTLSIARTISEVGYGNSFRKSEGGCWTITYEDTTNYPGGPPHQTGILPVPQDYSCGVSQDYTYDPASTDLPTATDDAIDDSMLRLLNGTLDQEHKLFANLTYNTNMTFHTEGKIGVQTLWGPVKMRLVIWS